MKDNKELSLHEAIDAYRKDPTNDELKEIIMNDFVITEYVKAKYDVTKNYTKDKRSIEDDIELARLYEYISKIEFIFDYQKHSKTHSFLDLLNMIEPFINNDEVKDKNKKKVK